MRRVLLVLMVTVLVACGGDSSDNAATEEPGGSTVASESAASTTPPSTTEAANASPTSTGDSAGAASTITPATDTPATATAEASPDSTATVSTTPTTGSATGGLLVFDLQQADGNSDIYTAKPDGSDVQRLTDHPDLDMFPAWSPDGTRIIFLSSRSRNIEIWTMQADGTEQTQLTKQGLAPNNPTFSPDGSRIVFSGIKPGGTTRDIYLINADGSSPVNLTKSPQSNDHFPAWSPDGSKITFVIAGDDSAAQLWVMNADDGSEPLQLTADLGGSGISKLDWSPDGTKIVYDNEVGGNRDIYVTNADGSSQLRLTEASVVERDPTWSPDGSQIAYVHGNSLAIIDADGSDQRLIELPGRLFNVVDWAQVELTGDAPTPDPAANGPLVFEVYVSETNNSDIYTVMPDGSAVQQLTDDPEADFAPDRSPDGTQIVFASRRTGRSELWTMQADGTQQTQLTDFSEKDFSAADPAFAPDGTRVAFGSSKQGAKNELDQDIYVINLDGSGLVNLTNTPKIADQTPAWSPDGTQIAFVSMNASYESQLWVMNADGSDLQQLTTNPDEIPFGPTWSPDGKSIAYSNTVGGDVNINVMDADGGNPVQLTETAGREESPTWSPDGTQIAFRNTDSPHALFFMKADGSDQHKVILQLPGRIDSIGDWSQAE